MKNFMDISVGTLTFWALGYGLMYGAKDASGFLSSLVVSGLFG